MPSSPCLITCGTIWAQLSGPEDAIHIVQEALTVETPGGKYTQAAKRGYWDGKTRLLRRPHNTFLAGLALRVAALLTSHGFSTSVTKAPLPQRPPLLATIGGVTLRDYQIEAADHALRVGRVALQCPTSGGKTEIAAEIVRQWGGRVLWVVHTGPLFSQTVSRLRDGDRGAPPLLPGIPIGTIGEGKWKEDAVTIAMQQTLSRHMGNKEFFKQWDGLIVDEAHHGSAETWFKIGVACENAQLRLGMSGTIRGRTLLQELRIEGVFGPIHQTSTTMELVVRGFLACPRIVFLQPPRDSYPRYEDIRERILPEWRSDPRKLAPLGGRMFALAYQEGVWQNERRNRLFLNQVYTHLMQGEKVLLLCTRIDHAALLHSLFVSKVKFPAWQLDGDAPREERKSTLEAFRATPESALLIATPFFREGVNIPEIDVLFLAGGGMSEIALLQAVGRGLRRRPDKPEVLIYDGWDGYDFNHPKDYLANHTKERLKVYKAQGFDVQVPRR